MQYTKSVAVNDVREPDEIVDEAFIERFISPDTLSWFRNLGGTEKVTKQSGGTIAVRSVSPDGEVSRLTVFTPVKDSLPEWDAESGRYGLDDCKHWGTPGPDCSGPRVGLVTESGVILCEYHYNQTP